MRILPHRYPFLLVDRVVEVEPDKRIVALDLGANISVDIFNMMMSRENASQRREWMETYGNLVEADIS